MVSPVEDEKTSEEPGASPQAASDSPEASAESELSTAGEPVASEQPPKKKVRTGCGFQGIPFD